MANKVDMLEINPINNLLEAEYINKKECIESNMNYGCSVCGEDEWCGTDGCPLDPQ